jgi:hypothetical protein
MQWERFLSYSRRVRTIHLDAGFHVDTTVIQALANVESSLCIAPSLRSLHWRTDGTSDAWSGLLFVTPGLQDLTIVEQGNRRPAGPVLLHALKACPHIRSLNINLHPSSARDEPLHTELIRSLADFFSKSAFLEGVVFDDASSTRGPVLQKLCALPRLKSLKLGNMWDSVEIASAYPLVLPSNPVIRPFQSLRELDIACSFDTATTLLDYLGSPLEDICIHVPEDETEQGGRLEQWLLAVQTKFNSSLTHFNIVMEHIGEDLWNARPLISFTSGMHLVHLYIHVSEPGVIIDDETLRGIGGSLPFLKLLDFRYVHAPNYGPVPLATLEGVFDILALCPWLEHLKVVFSALNALDEVKAQQLPISRLESLDIDWSPIDNPSYVAGLFSRVLPHLDDFIWGTWDGEESAEYSEVYESRWKIVWDLQPTLRK